MHKVAASAKGAEYESQGKRRTTRGASPLVRATLHKVADASAKGAEYESQGQAPNNARRVAPGKSAASTVEALKERNKRG